MWWKLNKWKVILPVVAAAILAFAFWYGGNAPGLHGWMAEGAADPIASFAPGVNTPILSVSPDSSGVTTPSAPLDSPIPTVTPTAQTPIPPLGAEGNTPPSESKGGMTAQNKDAATELPGLPSAGQSGNMDGSPSNAMVIDPETGKDKYLTDPVPEGKPLPVEPQDVTVSDVAHTCMLSVSCASILSHLDWLDPEKTELVPEDGVIFPSTQVTFYEGESVFNLLQREMKKAKIHLEFESTPIYNSVYIEGLNNLYEFDCGELSGWMYEVNGWFPNYGCSRYLLQEGDTVEWVYTCDLGKDVGGYNAPAG